MAGTTVRPSVRSSVRPSVTLARHARLSGFACMHSPQSVRMFLPSVQFAGTCECLIPSLTLARIPGNIPGVVQRSHRPGKRQALSTTQPYLTKATGELHSGAGPYWGRSAYGHHGRTSFNRDCVHVVACTATPCVPLALCLSLYPLSRNSDVGTFLRNPLVKNANPSKILSKSLVKR